MRHSLTPLLSCPVCRGAFSLDEGSGEGEHVRRGVLHCRGCGRGVPICAGFPLFGESAPDASALDPAALEARLFGAPERYADFVREKHRRPTRDLYAAITPFNEPAVGLLRFVALARRWLEPGDRILDLWCRTGWTGELLAGLFPEQTVVSLWERNVDVLGYRGFRFWLPEGQRAPNLEILFHHPGEPLPFADGAFGLVHGHDALHRYESEVLVPEALRAGRPDGVVLFPHVHLSNAEPEPWFDRGCTIRHGAEYAESLGERLSGSGRRAFVLSERALFERDDVVLEDDSRTTHYNALVAIVPEAEAGAILGLEPSIRSGAGRAVVNPLLRFDLDAATVTLDEARLEGDVGRMLDRHPLQRAALRAHTPARLTQVECEILHGAAGARRLDAIAAASGRSLAEVADAAQGMAARGWIELRHVSEAMARLQHFYADQAWRAPDAEHTVNALFDAACACHAERPLLRAEADGSVFRYADAAEVVARVAARLRRAGVAAGDRVGLVAPFSTEAALTFWGCLRAGAVLVPIDWTRPADFIDEVLDGAGVGLVFCDPARARALRPRGARRIVFDDAPEAQTEAGALGFSDWLEDAGDASGAAEPVGPEAAAVILHTSGTTGRPKALALSHGSLVRSGALLARTWGWRSDDVLASTGDLHAMSGLRNPCVAVLHAGASFLALPPETHAHPVALAESLQQGGATLLSTTPAVLQTLLRFEDRISRHALHSLRQALCTAAPLPPGLADAFEGRFGARVHDYYGLTETGGLCIGTPPGEKSEGIGRSLGCIAWIVSDAGEPLPAGEVGELWIFTENRATPVAGIAADPAGVIGPDGWCRTGDLAVRDEVGRIRLLGRRREIVKDARGELVSPAEIEAVLAGHEAVEAVGVCGFAGEDGTERIAAFVVARPGTSERDRLPDALRRLALERLGASRVPARVELVDRLPRGSDGSVLRSALAEAVHSGALDGD